ncbi:hypothetical protein D3C71_2063880 [compost metagenome]
MSCVSWRSPFHEEAGLKQVRTIAVFHFPEPPPWPPICPPMLMTLTAGGGFL